MVLQVGKNLLLRPEFSIIWTTIQKIIESLQLLSLFAVSKFAWPTAIIDAFDNISWITFDITGNTYNAFLITICTIITAYIAIVIISLLLQCCDCDIDCECDDIFQYIYWFIGDAILFGILFVPIAQILLEIFHCKGISLYPSNTVSQITITFT